MNHFKVVSFGLVVLPCLMAEQAPAIGEGTWPKEIVTDQLHVVLYQPQVDSWRDNRIEARSAVIVTHLGDPKQIFGVVSLAARTEVDRDTRVVTLEDIEVKGATFPTAAALQPMLLKAAATASPAGRGLCPWTVCWQTLRLRRPCRKPRTCG